VFILSQELGLYKFYQTQITECDAQIEECLAQFTDKVDVNINPHRLPKRRGKKQPGNAPQFDLRTHLYRITGVDFTQINGFGALTVLVILSEVGLDPSRFPTVKHFTSWLGLCPGSRVTGGKVKSSRISPCCQSGRKMLFAWQHKHFVVAILPWEHFTDECNLAWGRSSAITAAAHKLARIFYRMQDISNSLCRPRC
jgi:hypothetical protein